MARAAAYKVRDTGLSTWRSPFPHPQAPPLSLFLGAMADLALLGLALGGPVPS